MKKKLVAVAVAGILGAPLAAQAQTANVVMYGRLNLDLEIINGATCAGAPVPSGNNPCPNGTVNPTVSRLSSNSSRWGIRGTEALGGGLSAIFQLESSILGDASGGTLAGRETFIGFQGPWGTFKMGNFLMPLDDMHPIFGDVPTYTTSILSTATLWAQGALSKADGGFDTRPGNSLRYDSPSFSGLTFSGQVALQDSSGTTGANSGNHASELRHAYTWGGNAIYNNGPIQIGVGGEVNQKLRGPDLNDYDITVTGGYNFGVVRLAAVYEKLKYDISSAQGGGDIHRDLWGVSATIPMGPGTWYLSYQWAGNGKGSACDINDEGCTARVGGVAKGSDTKSQHYEVSYTYPFSKRTQVYAGYVKLNNDSQASYEFNINPYPIAIGGKPGGFVLGMIHLF